MNLAKMVDIMMAVEKWIRSGNDKGQATLELTISLVFVMLFLVSSIKIFLWLNTSIVNRQVDYENSRVAAASGGWQSLGSSLTPDDTMTEADLVIPGEHVVDESDKSRYPDLNLFSTSW